MIKVFYDENDLVIQGHAKDCRECCAAVSAAAQMAIACLAWTDCVRPGEMITEPYKDHGGRVVIHTAAMESGGTDILNALLQVLKAQAKAWPGQIDIQI